MYVRYSPLGRYAFQTIQTCAVCITQGPRKTSTSKYNIEQGQSPSTRAAHHRGHNTFVAPAKPAAPKRYRMVIICLYNENGNFFFSEQEIRKQCGYRSATLCCHPLVITHPGYFGSSDTQFLRYFHAMLSPPLVTACKRQRVPMAAACGITPLLITPPCGAGDMLGVPTVSHRTAITPLRYHPPREPLLR